MPQTSVETAPTRFHAGAISDPNIPHAVLSFKYEAGTVGSVPGAIMLKGTADDQATGIQDTDTVDASTVLGVFHSEIAQETGWPADEDMIGVLRRGVIVMTATVAVTALQPVFVGNVTATLNQIRGSAAANFVQAPGMRFLEDAGAGELVRVDVNL